ncbi:MAG: transcriptional regulator [Mesorhizobium sp.]|uniref:transcriptional regulator n=1 Tax=Mesorhizobium sp. TaxID=1871066 RepID=UPI000FE7696E|nr:transcriptional regulator [Mesorhizobium sp.]RWP10818.1 MAG: transcriptional regulator [Mesorhizobium sp.]
MVAANTILVVAPDRAFRQSLEFALEVEGFSVDSHAMLTQAEASFAAAKAVCMVVDESALAMDPAARQSLGRMSGPVILLVDGLSSTAAADGLTVLTKPIIGDDLIHLVHGLAARFSSDYVDSLRT